MIAELVDDIKSDEGFSGVVYKDSLGFDTVGYGTKMPINTDEAQLLLKHRLEIMIHSVNAIRPLTKELPDTAQRIIYNMAYQMGVSGLFNFRRMWRALDERDYDEAANEMLDSKWAKQTPERAKKLSDLMRGIGG